MLMRFQDSPESCQPGMVPPGSEHKVMHTSFRIGETTVMASNGQCGSTAEASYQSKSGPDSLSASTAFVGKALGVDAVIS